MCLHPDHGATIIEGSATTTEFMTGGVSFAMSTTTAGGMTVSASGGITLDSNDADNTKVFQVLTQ